MQFLTAFWKKHPALLLGISLLSGIGNYLYQGNLFFTLIWLFYLCHLGRVFFLQGFFFIFLGWFYCFFLFKNAPHAPEAIAAEGIFCISSLEPHSSPFGKKDFRYKGTFYTPEPISCSFCLGEKNRPLADQDYWVSGLLLERETLTNYTLKVKEWKKLPKSSWRCAEMRYQYKEKFRKFLKKKMSQPTANLLGSLVTGDVEDRSLRYSFNRTGLQHLLAISGFHFALLIAFLSNCLKWLMPRHKRFRIYLLLLALSLYFAFVGAAPAVLRSFLAAFLYFLAKLLGRQASSLNLLGVAMLVELLIDPLAACNIGFQLSFISSAGLLLLFTPLHCALQKWLPERSCLELSAMSKLSTLGYLICAFFRKSLSVTLAVNLSLLPLLFYHFHRFALLGLIYNLFFPLAISGALFLFIFSLLIYLFFSPIGEKLLSLTDWWTLQLLDLVTFPPLALEYSLLANPFSAWECILYLFVLFVFLISLQKNQLLTFQAIRK